MNVWMSHILFYFPMNNLVSQTKMWKKNGIFWGLLLLKMTIFSAPRFSFYSFRYKCVAHWHRERCVSYFKWSEKIFTGKKYVNLNNKKSMCLIDIFLSSASNCGWSYPACRYWQKICLFRDRMRSFSNICIGFITYFNWVYSWDGSRHGSRRQVYLNKNFTHKKNNCNKQQIYRWKYA